MTMEVARKCGAEGRYLSASGTMRRHLGPSHAVSYGHRTGWKRLVRKAFGEGGVHTLDEAYGLVKGEAVRLPPVVGDKPSEAGKSDFGRASAGCCCQSLPWGRVASPPVLEPGSLRAVLCPRVGVRVGPALSS